MRTIEEIKADYNKVKSILPEGTTNTDLCELEFELRQALIWDIPLDRLTEICNAERLIGRTVYLICKFMGGYTFVDCTVIRAELTDDNVFIWVQNITEGIDEYKVSINMIGKTVFFTKEEAEQALKGGAGND